MTRCRIGDPPYKQLDYVFDQYIKGHKITEFCLEWGCPLYLIAGLIANVESRKQIELELENGKLIWKADPETWKEMTDADWEAFLAENWAKGLTGETRQGIECFRNEDALITYCGYSPKFGYKKGNRSLNLMLNRAKIGNVREFLYSLYTTWA